MTSNPSATIEQVKQKLVSTLFEQKELTPERLNAIFENCRYIVALDVGGGTCSAAGVETDFYEDPVITTLNLTKSEQKSQWSAIGYTTAPDEPNDPTTHRIGRTAVSAPYFYTNFKEVPKTSNLQIDVFSGGQHEDAFAACRDRRTLMRDYIRRLFDQALACNPELSRYSRDQILVLAGHPSGEDWKGEDPRHNLETIVRQACGVHHVLTMSESNAAILYAINNWSHLGRARHILIIDLGAYSLDATYIDRHRQLLMEESIRLGGKEIDRRILELAVERAGMDPQRVNHTMALFSARVIKEKHWPKGKTEPTLYIDTADGAPGPEVTFSPRDMADTVEKMPFAAHSSLQDPNAEFTDSYTGHLVRFLEDVHAKIRSAQGDENQLDAVIVCGGASRMTPAMNTIRQTAMRLWPGLTENRICPDVITDSLTDCAVPHGMLLYHCKAMRALHEIPGVEKKLRAAVENTFVPAAVSSLSHKLTEVLYNDYILPQADKWAAAAGERSLQQLADAIQTRLKADSGALEKAIDQALTEPLRGLDESCTGIVNRLLEELYNTSSDKQSLTGNGQSRTPIVQVDLDAIRKCVEECVRTTVTNAIMEVLSVLAAVIILVPILIIYGGYELVAKFIGMFTPEPTEEEKQRQEEARARKAEAEAAEEAEKRAAKLNQPLSRGKRERKVKQLKKNKDQEFTAKLQTGIADALGKTLGESCEQTEGFGFPAAALTELLQVIGKSVYTEFRGAKE